MRTTMRRSSRMFRFCRNRLRWRDCVRLLVKCWMRRRRFEEGELIRVGRRGGLFRRVPYDESGLKQNGFGLRGAFYVEHAERQASGTLADGHALLIHAGERDEQESCVVDVGTA